jgi:integrase
MAKRTRGNGEGSLYRRESDGPWYASWWLSNGKRTTRSTQTTSRADAERIMRKWVERSALEREGLVAPEGGTDLERHARASIESHLGAFEATKRAEGRTERYVSETVTIIGKTAVGCGWRSLGEIKPEDLERFIGRKRAPMAKTGETSSAGWTPRTAHKYITAVRTFTRWCVADGRLAADPLARVKKPTPTRQRARRMLQVEEWRWLKAVTEHAVERYGMDGQARRLLYDLAIQTGLRAGELRSLTRSCLVLDTDRPYVLLEARRTKNRKAARQYIKPNLASELAEHVSKAMPGVPVFTMPSIERVAKMLRADLEDARKAWQADAGSDARDRIDREASDFLRAQDHDGRVLDFHALRHTCGAWAAMAGASHKALQTLMRHSTIKLTLDTYGHLLPDEVADTVTRMPDVEPVSLRLTGTDSTSLAGEPGVPTAVQSATQGQTKAVGGNLVREAKTENGPGAVPRPVSKRGGRDSNPQPSDRQSDALTKLSYRPGMSPPGSNAPGVAKCSLDLARVKRSRALFCAVPRVGPGQPGTGASGSSGQRVPTSL